MAFETLKELTESTRHYRVKAEEGKGRIFFEGTKDHCEQWIEDFSDSEKYKDFTFSIVPAPQSTNEERVQEARGGFFTEAKTYADSAEFTDEFYMMLGKIQDFKKIMKSPRWLAWMETTDNNFGTNTENPAREAIAHLVGLADAFNEIDREFDSAN